ncbi:MAG: hypothetical protein IT332_09500 [Ardenticatenales bacterium]|nr:hypothetical protein [Ardenticatenales bacterium]
MIKDFDRQKAPVAMFEYDVDAKYTGALAPMAARKNRYWASGGDGNLPLVLLNSGREVTSGSQEFKKKYGQMIAAAAKEPAAAEVKAWAKRSALDRYRVQVDVTNVGSTVLDPFGERPAMVVAFLVEDRKVVHMSNTARGVVTIDLPDELKPGQTVQVEGELAAEQGTNFNKVKVVAVVEYGDEDGWDIAGGTWSTMGERPAAVPPTATAVPPTDVPAPTDTPAPTDPPEPTDPPPPTATNVPPTAAPPTRYYGYLPMALFNQALGQQ